MKYLFLPHHRMVYPTVVLAFLLTIASVCRNHSDLQSIENIEITGTPNALQDLNKKRNVEESIEEIAFPIEELTKSLMNKTAESYAAPRLLPSGSNLWKYPIATAPASRPIRTIAMISMGPGAHRSRLVERILISIRKRGNYLGLVLILTDYPNRYELLEKNDSNLIILKPPTKDWKMELLEDMPYKRFKTYLLEYLNLNEQFQTVKYVYYLDIDIVVGRPLQEWFEFVEGSYMKSKSPFSQIIMFKGNRDNIPVQGGQFILQRGRSEGCLERWRYYIDSTPEVTKDQVSLRKMMAEEQMSGCLMTIMTQKPYLDFLSLRSMKRFHQKENYPTLMHIKNTGIDHLSKPMKRSFMQLEKDFFGRLLELSAEEVEQVTAFAYIVPNITWTRLQISF